MLSRMDAPRARCRAAGVQERRVRSAVDGGSLVRYLAVGLFSYGVNVVLLVAFVEGLGWNRPWVAAPVAFLLTFLVSYTLQRVVAFRSTATIAGSLARYALLVGFNAVAQAVLHALAERVGLGLATSQLIATALTTTWNYLAYRHWVYADVRAARPHAPVAPGYDGRATTRPAP